MSARAEDRSRIAGSARSVNESADFQLSCPAPDHGGGVVTLAMGGGGRAGDQLLERFVRPHLSNEWLDARHDGAMITAGTDRLAFTTDTYVVRPLEFPGGDIGRLAVYGTVNDLAVCGARARWLSLGLVLEEGLSLDTLNRIMVSLGAAARECGVAVVTGDTKVVERGRGDGIYINTAGIGQRFGDPVGPDLIRPGQRILVSGDLGRHGTAVLVRREGLAFETEIESDAAQVAPVVFALLNGVPQTHCLRDLTRGGLAASLVELARAAELPLRLRARSIPVHRSVRSACEVLGLDPMQLACEGRFVAFVDAAAAAAALDLLRRFDPDAAEIGRVLEPGQAGAGEVVLESELGVDRLLEMPSGENLPRIC